MSTIGNLMKGVTDYLKGPTRDPHRAQTLKQQQANLKTSIREVDAEIARLQPGGWSAAAKATRQQNAPRVAELRTQRSQLSDQLLTVEKELLGGKAALSSQAMREMR